MSPGGGGRPRWWGPVTSFSAASLIDCISRVENKSRRPTVLSVPTAPPLPTPGAQRETPGGPNVLRSRGKIKPPESPTGFRHLGAADSPRGGAGCSTPRAASARAAWTEGHSTAGSSRSHTAWLPSCPPPAPTRGEGGGRRGLARGAVRGAVRSSRRPPRGPGRLDIMAGVGGGQLRGEAPSGERAFSPGQNPQEGH